MLLQKLKPKQSNMAVSFVFDAIGTSWKIDIEDPLSAEDSLTLKKIIQDRIEIFDKDYSRFRADSLVTQMSQQAGEYRLPDDAERIMDIYKKMYDLTGGMMTPLIGSLMVEAGYDAKYSLRPKELHHPAKWEDVLEYNFPNIFLKQPALLDFGAAGKGYAIDIMADILRSKNIQSFCVDAGQDILYFSKKNKPMRVGLENPNDFTQVIAVADICDQSICGSSGSRRKWANFHHIMHPFALESVKNILATWAIAPTALVADALATALFFVPGAFLQTEYDFEYIVLYSDFSIEKSIGFRGEIFTK